MVEALEYPHATARPGQIARGHQTVVSTADDDDVGAGVGAAAQFR